MVKQLIHHTINKSQPTIKNVSCYVMQRTEDEPLRIHSQNLNHIISTFSQRVHFLEKAENVFTEESWNQSKSFVKPVEGKF